LNGPFNPDGRQEGETIIIPLEYVSKFVSKSVFSERAYKVSGQTPQLVRPIPFIEKSGGLFPAGGDPEQTRRNRDSGQTKNGDMPSQQNQQQWRKIAGLAAAE
jgi:hypothetical protein